MKLHTWLLLGAIASAVTANQQMPRFEFSRSSSIMLTWDDKWEAGGSNMLAILSDGKKIVIRVSVVGDTGTGLKRLLIYRCPRSLTDETIDLSSLTPLVPGSSAPSRCSDTISFQISATASNSDEFFLTMGSSKLSYLDVFTQRIELNVRVEYSSGYLMSNKLFIWSLDAISSFSSVSSSTANTRRFLTDAAITFMKKMNVGAGEFSSLPFLDPEISRVIREAPDFFKAKMNLGAILCFDAGNCVDYQNGKSVMFVNYNSKLDDINQKFQKLMRLSIDDGSLWYSTCGLKNEVKMFYDEKNPQRIGICSIASFSGEVEPYMKADAVQLRVPISEVSYSTCSTGSKNCYVVPGTNPDVTILSGMDFTAIVCPIICNDKTGPFNFYHDDRMLIPSQVEDWSYVEGVRISKTGNIVEFPPTLSSTHSGAYRCEASGKTFTFTVKVISLPQFQTETYASGSRYGSSGLLPPKVFAMEGETLSYNCAVYFASLDTVKIDPVFYFPVTTGGTSKWDKLTLDAFKQKVGADSANFYIAQISESKDIKRLNVTVARVPSVHQSYGTNFTHRFVCDASIAQSESMKVGMPTYTVQSGGDVVFVPRPVRSHFNLNPSNNCSVQKCAFGKGANFEFSLTDEFMAYLTGIGVEVVSYLRIDNDLLSDVKILFNSNASEIEPDISSQRLSYKVYPVSDRDVAAELVKRKQLTPVFNLRYKTGSDLGNLKLDKETHGTPNVALGERDCRADRLCFYSTDFDLNSTLSFLPVSLTFTMPPPAPPVTTANAMIIGIVIAAICLIVGIILIVYFARRNPERAYFVEEKEIQLGHNPKEEAKGEVFKEYQRVANQPGGEEGDAAPLQGNRMSLGSSLSVASGDDKELDQYKEDIDFKDFGEQGSFIGGYQGDQRKKEAFEAAQAADGDAV